ncbi:protein naked cuticle homolog 1-like isoform X2 [Dendronephthya gigantea]|uniref:protein naked cuticle homolog 1-like isoform X2 n=1 Tax=Dendronephthya gigantea TaxID=151771 RepID=UPI00106AE342|nr:protein naked cuticle homolog 1-like isoform X2 [Dendronephthya gigantea]
MGKRHSRPSIQAWISRESPEGGCVIINDTSSQTRLLEEILKQKRTVTSYEGYLVNEEDNLDPGVLTGHHSTKSKSVESFPLEIVDLPAEPDGKQIDIHFVKEGNMDERTQTALKPEDIDCGVSIRSMGSDKQQWSFSLYNFEENGRISKEDLTNLVKSIYDALGKSVDTANKKHSREAVKKVKVHISLSKEKSSREMRGAAVVPRREVVVGAEDHTAEAEKQLERLKLKEHTSSQEGVAKKPSRRRKDGYSTVQVLNNDLGNARLASNKCKCCSSTRENKKRSQTEKNSNLLADKPSISTRRKTEPGGCFTVEQKPAQELAQLAEKKLKVRSQRRTRRRSASPGGNMPGFSHLLGDAYRRRYILPAAILL